MRADLPREPDPAVGERSHGLQGTKRIAMVRRRRSGIGRPCPPRISVGIPLGDRFVALDALPSSYPSRGLTFVANPHLRRRWRPFAPEAGPRGGPGLARGRSAAVCAPRCRGAHNGAAASDVARWRPSLGTRFGSVIGGPESTRIECSARYLQWRTSGCWPAVSGRDGMTI